MGFSRQEYWRALLFSSPGDLSNPGIEPESLTSPALAGGFFTAITTWGAQISVASSNYSFMAHLVPSPLQKINARVTRKLEFYPMIESGRVATVHKLPLWRILVPDFWNPSRAAYILQMCALQGCSWSLASLLIPLLSLLPGCSRPQSPCLLCAANPGHIQAAELWHWQSHQGCFLLRMFGARLRWCLVRKSSPLLPRPGDPGAQNPVWPKYLTWI